MLNFNLSTNTSNIDSLENEIFFCSSLIEISEACARARDRTDNYAREQIQQIFHRSTFNYGRFHVIGERIYQLAGCPKTDPQMWAKYPHVWGKHHALDDLSRLQQAIAELVLEKFQQLTPNQRLEKFIQENTRSVKQYSLSLHSRLLQVAAELLLKRFNPHLVNKSYTKDDIPALLHGVKQHLLSLHKEVCGDNKQLLVKSLRNQLKKENRCDPIWMQTYREKLATIFALDLSNLNLDINLLLEFIDYFPNLRILDLRYNQLTELPENFGSSWKNLQFLRLDENNLIQIPENFGSSWKNLRGLRLDRNNLVQIPENFGSFWRDLYELRLDRNNLVQIPENFGASWPNLETLRLTFNQLTQLPENFGSSWPNLQELNLANNQLTQLREDLGSFWRTVSQIYLDANPLTSLPLSITNFPAGCRIYLENCRLSQQVLSRLRAITQTPGYAGPRFSYSLEGLEGRRADIPEVVTIDMVNEQLTDLFAICQQAPRQYPNLIAQEDEMKTLFLWLNRLSYTADYQQGGDLQKGFAEKILSYLDLAEREPRFRATFLAGVEGAAETCGDRVALSILHIGLAYRLEQINPSDLPGLANLLLRGTLALSLLEEEARNKIPALPFYDEIEVYLGYPIKLKKELDLPIDVEEMLYFRCSSLQDADLEQAKQKVLAKLNDKQESHRFLVQQEKWMKALEARYPSEYASIEEIRERKQDEDSPNYTEIQEVYEQIMMALTGKALSDDAVLSISPAPGA